MSKQVPCPGEHCLYRVTPNKDGTIGLCNRCQEKYYVRQIKRDETWAAVSTQGKVAILYRRIKTPAE
jgi:hypothetical protein